MNFKNTDYDDFITLLDVHEALNKESEQTLANSFQELRGCLDALYYSGRDKTTDDDRRGQILQLIGEIRYSGYREGFKDAIKQMDVVMKKNKTRAEQLQAEKLNGSGGLMGGKE